MYKNTLIWAIFKASGCIRIWVYTSGFWVKVFCLLWRSKQHRGQYTGLKIAHLRSKGWDKRFVCRKGEKGREREVREEERERQVGRGRGKKRGRRKSQEEWSSQLQLEGWTRNKKEVMLDLFKQNSWWPWWEQFQWNSGNKAFTGEC